MTSGIDEAHVRHIAALSRLTLSPEEGASMSRELSAIVGYFDQLRASADAIDPPTLQGVSLQDGLRDDAIRPSFDAATALTNAPRREGVFFRVPKVLDTEGGG